MEDTDPILGLPLATRPPPPSVFAALTPRYEILGEVAQGGMGVVYRARQKALDRTVAIKILLPGSSPERFLREARLLARAGSPHVVAVHDFEVLPDGSPILVMEWIDGSDLRQMMKARGGLVGEELALPLMRGTCLGMLAAANQGIIHRDLKPSNILIDGAGEARVVDFGLARGPLMEAELSLSLSNEVLGTPFYMAPEQWEDPRGLDTRADIYSFGATFYHALTGVTPFRGRSGVSILFSHKTEPVVSPRARNREISERTSDLIERCLAKAPADRFQSFAEVIKHLGPEGDASPWDDPDDPDLVVHLEAYQKRREAYLLRLMTPNEVDTYELPGRRVIRVMRGDLVTLPVEAIVSSDDGDLSMLAGVSRAIREAAGPEMVAEARRYKPVRAGRAVVTSGGNLGVRFIFHGITLEFTRDKPSRPSRDLISEIMNSCFYHADSLYVERIAFPLLGTGSAGFPEDVCLDTMFRYLARTFLHRVTAVREATIVLYS